MRTIGATAEAAFVSGDVTPVVSATIRNLAMDFGGSPLVLSTYNVIAATTYASDDYYGNVVWGDSCVTALGGYYFRLINKAAWAGTSDYLASWTTNPAVAANWEYTDIANTDVMAPYCRLGIYPKAASDDVYVWYAKASDKYVYLSKLDFSPVGWTAISTGLDVSDGDSWGGLAIHPVAEDKAFVVGYTSPYLWIRYIYWNGVDWTSSGSRWILWMTEDIAYDDAHWSDAVSIGGNDYVILVNLSMYGSTYAIRYNSTTGIFSQPILAAGAGSDLTGYRVKVSGASFHNGRIWAVVQKSLEASDYTPQASHVALLSSTDGRHWREDDFIGVHPCYGKLLYNNSTKVYIAGNAAVYEGNATYKLGTDVSTQKRVLDEDVGFTLSCASGNTPHQLTVNCLDVDDNLDTDPIVCPGAEITLEVTSYGQAQNTIFKAYLEEITTTEKFNTKAAKIVGRGPISTLSGKAAYHPPVGKMYESPSSYYSNFNFAETGRAQLTVAQQTGKWTAITNVPTGKFELKGEKGIALLPRNFATQWLTLLTHFRAMVSLEGVFVILLWEDSSNYWRIGLTRTAGSSQIRFVLQKITGGVVSQKDTSNVTVAPDTACSLYIDYRPGMIRGYLKLGSDNFTTPDATVSYDLTTETGAVPIPHHIGFEVLDWIDYEASYKHGTCTSNSPHDSLIDTGQTFVAGDVGKYIRVGEQWRKTDYYTTNAIYVSLDWAPRPVIGDKYGLYDEPQFPYIQVKDIAVCDGNPAWTVDDIVDDILEVAGTSRADVFTGTIYPIASSEVGYAMDVRTTDATPGVYIHASAQSSFSCWYIQVSSTFLYLYRYTAGASVLTQKFPILFAIPSLSDTEIRVVFADGTAYLYAGDHYIGAFWNLTTAGSGYIGVPAGNTGVTTEFPTLKESFVWDANEMPSSTLAKLLRGRPAKLIEKAGGTIAVSKFSSHSDLGTWATTVVQTDVSASKTPSMIGIEGADTRQYYLLKDAARKGVLFRQVRNESAVYDLETLLDAVRIARLSSAQALPMEATLHVPDLKAELEDKVVVDGSSYVIEGYTINCAHQLHALKWEGVYRMRQLGTFPVTGVWGTSKYGQTYWG